jgi:peptidyl-prolyl cis-trans isomerase D
MMRQMRDKMKVIMIVTSVAFVGLMVFGWGMDITGRSTGRPGVVGSVNGESITYDEFNVVYKNLYDQEQRARAEPITSAVTRQLEDATWNQLVMQKLVQQELERRGIRVSDEEVRQAAKLMPPPELAQNQLFQTNGQFDLQKYQQFLASPAVDNQLLLQLESYYRDVIPRSKLFYQVTSGTYISDGELWRIWKDGHDAVKARFVALDPAQLVPDAQVSVSDAEIATYYNAHKDEFKRPARAQIQIVSIPKEPNAADTASARQAAESAREEIAKGADFATVAKRVSKDPGSAAQGGDLGNVRKGQMVPAFDQAVWSLPVGEVSAPVQTQFGFHVIQVQSRDSAGARVRHILVPVTISGAHEDELLAHADTLESLGEKLSLPVAAQRLGLTPRSVEIVKDLPVVPGVGPIDEGADWIFGEAKPKEVSQVFEGANAFYMIELGNKTEAGTLSQQEAAPTIRQIVAKEKKLAKATEIARQMVDQIRGGQSLDQVAAARGVPVREAGPFTRGDMVPGLGRANAAIGTAFGLQPGQISGAVQANDLVYIVQSVERTDADRAEFDKQKQLQRARLMQAASEQRWQEFLTALRQTAKIKDNREQVLRPANTQQPQQAGVY